MKESNTDTWRVIDTGLRAAAENIALNRAILEAHKNEGIPNTLRFLRFHPSALVGYHQSVSQELRLDYCREQKIDVQRRITGGGAIYFDPGHLGWELYVDRKTFARSDMESIARKICEAVADGISRSGVDAKYRPRNDIEVDGRKISGSGGIFDGGSLMYQGTLLLDMDIERMLKVLRIPAEKFSDKAIASARERVVGLRDLLGSVPPVDEVKRNIMDAVGESFALQFTEEEELTVLEDGLYRQALAEIDSHNWIFKHERPVSEAPIQEGLYRAPGGLIRVSAAVDLSRGVLKQCWITGDFFVTPSRVIVDLEAALKNTPVKNIPEIVSSFFSLNDVSLYMLEPQDFIEAIRLACAGEAGESD